MRWMIGGGHAGFSVCPGKGPSKPQVAIGLLFGRLPAVALLLSLVRRLIGASPACLTARPVGGAEVRGREGAIACISISLTRLACHRGSG